MIGNKIDCINYINSLKDDAIIEVKQKQKKSIRSSGQNKYYWGVVVKVIGDYHGLKPIAVNEMLKTMFECKTFTDLSTSEFKFLIDSIIELWIVTYNVQIPLPIDSGLERSLMECLY